LRFKNNCFYGLNARQVDNCQGCQQAFPSTVWHWNCYVIAAMKNLAPIDIFFLCLTAGTAAFAVVCVMLMSA
jgi:hypothetical protein